MNSNSLNYFATYEQMNDIIKSNKKLEEQLKNLNYLKSEEYEIIPNNIPHSGVKDLYFGCDTQYVKLLTRNNQLKHEINKLIS